MYKASGDELVHALDELGSGGIAIGVGFRRCEPTWVHSTYPQAWIDHYVECGFLAIDPTIQFGLRNIGHALWSDLGPSPLFEAAARFGIASGNTISIAINGTKTIASVAGEPWSSNEITSATIIISALHHIHVGTRALVELKPRERQVAGMMALDMRDNQIAEELGCAVQTIRQDRTTMYARTNTSTPAGLIAYLKDHGEI